MAKISPNQFGLISGTNKLVLRTLDIGVPVTSSGGGTDLFELHFELRLRRA